MAVSFIGVSNTLLNVASQPTLTIDLERSQSELAGDIMLAIIQNIGGQAITPPSGWDTIGEITYTRNGESFRVAVYKRIFVGGDPASWTWTRSGATQTMTAIMASYRPTATEIVGPNGSRIDTTFGSTVEAPGVTAVFGGMLVCFFALRGITTPNTVAPPTGMTERFDQFEVGDASGFQIADLVVGAGDTGTRTATAELQNFMGSGWSIMLEALLNPIYIKTSKTGIRIYN